MRQIASVKCTGVIAQVNLGFYDEEGHLVGEETFPQVGDNVGAAKLFHPHLDQLASLIESCVGQAWEKLSLCAQLERPGEPPAANVRIPAEKGTNGAG